MKSFTLFSASLLPFTLMATEQQRPNILWLTFEDTSDYELGCYGHPMNKTPVIDDLAARGLQFMNAYSNGPQSSPARSTIITGCYATTYAMEWHRSRIATPEGILFPQFLRQAGYYCTNNQKTDYNTKLDNKACWDENSNKASYNSPNRKPDQPFFAVFNSAVTHMSRLTSIHLDGRRDFAKEGLDPAKLPLPPHVPDIEAIRSDYAFHLEGMSDVDKWVKIFLDDLKAKGLEDNTIIFVFSDHGGCLPRGKGFCYETSYRVPMVVYLPQKWQRLSKMAIGKKCDRMVAFVDLAPTVLSLAGVEPPAYMQGMAFLGKYDKQERTWQFGLTGNQASHYTPIRTVSDGRWKYVRRFIPYKSDGLLNAFQWQMPSNLYWDKSYYEGQCVTPACALPFERNEAELLYDLSKDYFEINNLANDPACAKELERMRGVLADHMRNTKDLGLFLRTTRGGNVPLYDRVRSDNYDLEALYKLAEMTATVSAKDLPKLTKLLASKDPDTRFWATINMGQLARHGKLDKAPPELIRLMSDNDGQIANEAIHAVCYTSHRQAAFDNLLNRKSATPTVVEVLSTDKKMNALIPETYKEIIRARAKAEGEVKKSASAEETERNVSNRKILVNWGELPAEELYGPNVYEAGLKVNKMRRLLNPTPAVN